MVLWLAIKLGWRGWFTVDDVVVVAGVVVVGGVVLVVVVLGVVDVVVVLSGGAVVYLEVDKNICIWISISMMESSILSENGIGVKKKERLGNTKCLTLLKNHDIITSNETTKNH